VKLLESITRKESSSYLHRPERKQNMDPGSPTRHPSPQEMISDLRLQTCNRTMIGCHWFACLLKV
jgi:hypothetical protein